MKKLKANLAGYQIDLRDILSDRTWKTIEDAVVKHVQAAIQNTADDTLEGGVAKVLFFSDSKGPQISLTSVVAGEDEWVNHPLEDLIRNDCQGSRQDLDCVADELERLAARLRQP